VDLSYLLFGKMGGWNFLLSTLPLNSTLTFTHIFSSCSCLFLSHILQPRAPPAPPTSPMCAALRGPSGWTGSTPTPAKPRPARGRQLLSVSSIMLPPPLQATSLPVWTSWLSISASLTSHLAISLRQSHVPLWWVGVVLFKRCRFFGKGLHS